MHLVSSNPPRLVHYGPRHRPTRLCLFHVRVKPRFDALKIRTTAQSRHWISHESGLRAALAGYCFGGASAGAPPPAPSPPQGRDKIWSGRKSAREGAQMKTQTASLMIHAFWRHDKSANATNSYTACRPRCQRDGRNRLDPHPRGPRIRGLAILLANRCWLG